MSEIVTNKATNKDAKLFALRFLKEIVESDKTVQEKVDIMTNMSTENISIIVTACMTLNFFITDFIRTGNQDLQLHDQNSITPRYISKDELDNIHFS